MRALYPFAVLAGQSVRRLGPSSSRLISRPAARHTAKRLAIIGRRRTLPLIQQHASVGPPAAACLKKVWGGWIGRDAGSGMREEETRCLVRVCGPSYLRRAYLCLDVSRVLLPQGAYTATWSAYLTDQPFLCSPLHPRPRCALRMRRRLSHVSDLRGSPARSSADWT